VLTTLLGNVRADASRDALAILSGEPKALIGCGFA
jgi:hypothetical protein